MNFFKIVLSTVVLSFYSMAAVAFTVDMRSSDGRDQGSVQWYQHHYALLIANDNYAQPWSYVQNSASDTALLAKALKAHGFEVERLSNANAQSMRSAIERFFDHKAAHADARLFLWFSGHAETIDGKAYLIPVGLHDRAAVPSSAVSLSFIQQAIAAAQAKHVLTVSNACFSPAGSTDHPQPKPYISTQSALKSSQVLTSCRSGEQASERGLFVKTLIRGIHGGLHADVNGDDFVSVSELASKVSEVVQQRSKGQQTPMYAALAGKGDMVFLPPSRLSAHRQQREPIASAVVSQLSDSAAEIAYWESVKDSQQIAMLQSYIDRYPKGIFSTLAALKIAALQTSDQSYRLTIHAIPSAARIRILNINPTYHDGMRLPEGRYHIEVSHAGYHTKKLWLSLNGSDLSKTIRLEKRAHVVSAYKTRAQFDSDAAYGRYVKRMLHKGMRVRVLSTHGSLKRGDLGTYYGTNGGNPPCFVIWDRDLKRDVTWLEGAPKSKRSHAYWVKWHDVQILDARIRIQPTASSSTTAAYKSRSDFSSSAAYARYVEKHLRKGMRVRALKKAGRVRAGDVGTYYGQSPGDPPALVVWDRDLGAEPNAWLDAAPVAKKSHGYWVMWDNMQLLP